MKNVMENVIYPFLQFCVHTLTYFLSNSDNLSIITFTYNIGASCCGQHKDDGIWCKITDTWCIVVILIHPQDLCILSLDSVHAKADHSQMAGCLIRGVSMQRQLKSEYLISFINLISRVVFASETKMYMDKSYQCSSLWDFFY